MKLAVKTLLKLIRIGFIPDTGSNMLKNKENEHHKKKTLKTDTNLEDLVQILDHLVALLDDFEHADHSCHSDNFVEFSNTSYSS